MTDPRIEIDREDDGRYIADIPELPGVMAYGQTEQDAVANVQALASRVNPDPRDERIAQLESALGHVLPTFRIGARAVACDYDPAGSTTGFVPDERDLKMLAGILGREVREDDLFFMCGGYAGTYYSIPQALIVAALTPKPDAAPPLIEDREKALRGEEPTC